MDKDIPRIATYDRRKIFKWPDSQDFVEDPYEYIEGLHLTTQTCSICNTILKTDRRFTEVWGMEPHYQYVLICYKCGFWKGRQFIHGGFSEDCDIGIVGRIRKTPLNSANIPTSDLLRYITKNQSSLTKISPYRAERFVMDIMSDWFGCEAISLGGNKDGGVDGILMMNDSEPVIVQVKWRQDISKAESISVVRELAGTMLVKGIPSGFLVSTRTHVSPQTESEIENINKRYIDGLGLMRLEYKAYNDLIDMISLSNRKISEKPEIDILGVDPDDLCSLFYLESEDEEDLLISDADISYINRCEDGLDSMNDLNNNIFWTKFSETFSNQT